MHGPVAPPMSCHVTAVFYALYHQFGAMDDVLSFTTRLVCLDSIYAMWADPGSLCAVS